MEHRTARPMTAARRRPPGRGGLAAPAALLAAALLTTAVTVTVLLHKDARHPPGAAPPAPVLSRYETAASGNTIDRDCGYSVALTGHRSLWLFCDSVWKGTHPGLVFGATAATGTAAPGRVPTDLTELPAPAPAPATGRTAAPRSAGPADRPPQPLLATPPGLLLPGGAPCHVPGTAYSASWISGAARLPDGSVLLTYTDVCAQSTTITTQGYGIAAYRPADGTLHGQTRVFTLPGGLPFQLTLGSPVLRDGHLYLYGSTCDTWIPGACAAGRATLARVPADPAAWRDPSAYRYWSPAGWTPDASRAATVVPGAAPAAVHVADYTAAGKGLVLIEQRGLDGRYRLWRAPAPQGPWRPAGEGTLPCSGGTGNDQCRAFIGHPELSTPTALMMSHYNPANRHVTLRAVPW
ncbi:hypothetical protein [Actinomadura opuntiae]|uniref:hypothetical protein n=1 Tax=Actinomadura sp. OS1-43 TaxID=604315 RepID=UPI00255AD944|nr:hypothetical protein [Actinomadura sp. OS1-43]MDL4812641.1 hypothetical protein [Actinomadura sp. OS1-43]